MSVVNLYADSIYYVLNTLYALQLYGKKWKTQKWFILNICYVLLSCVFCAVLSFFFERDMFVLVPLNLTCLQCWQQFYF